MKVALVHDFLTQDGGAERVLSVLADMYPHAPIFTLAYDARVLGRRFSGKDIRTSFIQRLPGGIHHYQRFLPLMPTAIEALDVSGYDVVISSASAFAKGVLVSDDAVHICYCHTPTRYLWSDSVSYLNTLSYARPIQTVLPYVLTKMRPWDRLAANRPDIMVANSEEVERRIKKYYEREATVIYPPVDTEAFAHNRKPEDYFLTGGRLVGYKRFAIVIEACTRLRLPLRLFGTGPDEARLKKLAGPSVSFLGHISKDELARSYASCIAFIHPQVEDFGITAVEAMAAGAPVIAYAKGGALETVHEGVSGTFFDEQSWEALADTLARFSQSQFSEPEVRQDSKRYAREVFVNKFSALVASTSKAVKV
ncbi:glycosyltransferase family 4 protein [Candidatus Uhrbacteria bacterium CG10_big_fil_rev_8_21_14_0_10_48_11]|uniref:Glycosyltransferase family 4 protein n=1 Tax=Candidatus Uhrbacteria bacterium CG10_big_fil_rev_8_21_14_0_10_48_11 TaxID=1975037 RepID=A0A2M8LFJ8_9BACT|nr:MAG: glycosyltransferase family 4 protein [Candidatus Uhrbacteria bacterium CG10_big_fil_rev_8_21_14_0_10_48_11]